MLEGVRTTETYFGLQNPYKNASRFWGPKNLEILVRRKGAAIPLGLRTNLEVISGRAQLFLQESSEDSVPYHLG